MQIRKPIRISFAEMKEAALKKQQEQAAAAQAALGPLPPTPPSDCVILPVSAESKNPVALQSAHTTLPLNEAQARFVALVQSSQDVVLIGSAGTGKSFSTREAMYKLREIEPVFHGVHSYLPTGALSVLVVSFTNRAVKNSRKFLGPDFYENTHTIHRALEYAPVYFDEWNEEKGEYVSTMRFEPQRNKDNPCPEVSVVIIEEAGQCSLQLHDELRAAFPKARFIYIGDIYQLPPIYGSSILGYKLAEAAAGEVPLVELTHVYRQALDSPILRYALAVKNGSCLEFSEAALKRKPRYEWASTDSETGETKSRLIINVIDPKTDPYGSLPRDKEDREFAIHSLNRRFGRMFQKTLLAGNFNPDQDVVLIPHKKPHTFGAFQLNRYIADAIRERDGLELVEVISGFNKNYFAIGDRLTNGRVEGKIVSLERNRKYFGKFTRPPSKELNRWGKPVGSEEALAKDMEAHADSIDYMTPDDIDALLKQDSVDERTAQCSHIITIETAEGQRLSFQTSREVNELDYCYALTCHQAQGSEWDRVFILLHSAHANMYSREWLYTAMTRAKKECYIICRPPALQKCIERQVVKGETLAEKAEFFKGKKQEKERYEQLKMSLAAHLNGVGMETEDAE
jgi:hypothetical protein